MRPILCGFICAAGLLAGCSPKGEAAKSQTGPAVASAEARAGTAASDLPRRKPGMWETRITALGRDGAQHVFTTRLCLDAATESLTPIDGNTADGDCSRAMARAGDSWTFDSQCRRSGRTLHTHAVATGRFDSAYRVDVVTTTEPPAGQGERRSTIDATWIGACPNGMKPGDVTGKNGLAYNLAAPGKPDWNGGRIRSGAAEVGSGDGSAHGPGVQ